jgi:chorismate synthase
MPDSVRFLTAGEALTAVIDGVPAGLALTPARRVGR